MFLCTCPSSVLNFVPRSKANSQAPELKAISFAPFSNVLVSERNFRVTHPLECPITAGISSVSLLCALILFMLKIVSFLTAIATRNTVANFHVEYIKTNYWNNLQIHWQYLIFEQTEPSCLLALGLKTKYLPNKTGVRLHTW